MSRQSILSFLLPLGELGMRLGDLALRLGYTLQFAWQGWDGLVCGVMGHHGYGIKFLLFAGSEDEDHG